MKKTVKILRLKNGLYFDTYFRCVVRLDGERAPDGTYATKFFAFPEDYDGDCYALPTIDQGHGA